jgi:MFS family permease
MMSEKQPPCSAAEHQISGSAEGRYGLKSSAFVGFLLTQFLGAFNDNYFKQMVLLMCVGMMTATGKDRQPLALAAFALPFVLLSGFGGFLSDRFSRQRVIVGCKIGEMAIMSMALLVLLLPGISEETELLLLILVLALMGAHSAIFGPSKYGSLPELFRPDVLLPVNGAVQMTTFLAIIFGMVAAGIALDQMNRSMWMGSLIAIGIAAVGTLTALLIPRQPPAQPQLQLSLKSFGVPADVWKLLVSDRRLSQAIFIASLFWFIGGVAQPAVNSLGRNAFHLSDTRTSVLASGIGIGIAAGCILVGLVAGNRARFWVTGGAWGITVSLLCISVAGSGILGKPEAGAMNESILQSLLGASGIEWLMRGLMVLLGLSAGIFVVPIQVFIQQCPPPSQKGRVLGVQNLFNWIGILLSAVFLALMNAAISLFWGATAIGEKQYLIFLVMSFVMMPVAFRYRVGEAVSAAQPAGAAE